MLVTCSSCGKVIDASRSESYYVKQGNVCFIPGGNSFERGSKKMDADPQSFQPLAETYGKDSRHVFFRGSKQEHIDLNSFQVEKGIPKDKSHVYCYMGDDIDFNRRGEDVLSIIEQADPSTFQRLNAAATGFAKDKNHYYYRNRLISVDYKSFQILNARFMKDDEKLYLDNGELFLVVDKSLKEAEKVNNEYVLVDGNKLFYFQPFKKEGVIKSPLSPNSLPIEVVDDDLLKTQKEVFLFGRPIPGADPKTLRVLFKTKTELIAKDKKHIYYNLEVIPLANPETYQLLDGRVGKDDRFVYYTNKKIDVPDVEGFRKVKDSPMPNVTFQDNKGNVYDAWGVKQESKSSR